MRFYVFKRNEAGRPKDSFGPVRLAVREGNKIEAWSRMCLQTLTEMDHTQQALFRLFALDRYRHT